MADKREIAILGQIWGFWRPTFKNKITAQANTKKTF